MALAVVLIDALKVIKDIERALMIHQSDLLIY
jgi:hypothetical protein